ncbi:MAG: DUF3320 domain-containing protein, partial [Ferruginibacter sp.]
EIIVPAANKTDNVVLNNASFLKTTGLINKDNSANMYKICELEIVWSSSSNDFLDFANTLKIKNQINQVLEIEAPIKRNLLAKRVLAAWGISKLGSRIRAHFDMLLSQMEIKQKGKNEDLVFWNNTSDPENYEEYRVATINGEKRDAEDLLSDEIANGIKEILINQISLPRQDLIREAAKLFGFARTGAQVELAMKKGISMSLAKGYIRETEGRLVIKEG